VADDTQRGPCRVVATYDNYRDAERAVGYLADHRFRVERVTPPPRPRREAIATTSRRR
jgi:hypothetical protein